MRDLRRLATLIAVLSLLALPGASALARPSVVDLFAVVVTLIRRPLAQASTEGRWLSSTRTRGRLSLRSPASRSYVRTLASAQRSLQSRIASTAPGARFGWRYTVVTNGFS